MSDESARRIMVRAAMKAPYLDREEEHALATRWRDEGDTRALHRIATAHMRLVVSMATRFRHYGLPVGDLIQEGCIGLLEAASRFDPAREVRFSTYASWWIRAAMQDYVLRNWSIVRGGTSSSQKALFFNLRRLRAQLARTGETVDRNRLHRQVAAALGVSQADVEMMDSRLSAPDASLNAPALEDSGSASDRIDFIPSDDPLPDELVGDAIDQERRSGQLRRALDVLDARELRIIEERRLSEDGATLESLGARLGISKERVRQLECRALGKLKSALMARSGAIFAQGA